MYTTRINAEVLRAALRRNGVWFVDLNGNPTKFYHRKCLAALPMREQHSVVTYINGVGRFDATRTKH
jgi:hypothetical protein